MAMGDTPRWSRRPHIGTLPRIFQSTLPAAAGLSRLREVLEGPGMVGVIDGNAAWLRQRGWPRPPAATLRLVIHDGEAGARVQCRFDSSRWDAIDLWVYTGVATVGFAVASSWLGGRMPPMMRDKVTSVVPAFIAFLTAVAVGHAAFRRWRQSVRDRLFDRAMIALGVPIS